MSCKEIVRKNYTVVLEEPELYVDNKSRKKSGHMSHAMAKFAPDTFIDFNSCSSGTRWDGHSPFGYIEYRISNDAGKTYSDVQILPYSMESILEGIYAISVEKAVTCNDGTLVAFCLRNAAAEYTSCEPWDTPTVITSSDRGKTWSEPYVYSEYKGRTYDAVYYDNAIYAMHLCNPNFLGNSPEHVYRIYKSTDNGKSFEELSVIPFETTKRAYGSILFDDNGKLHAYAYNEQAETELDHAVSDDFGKTWTLCKPCHLDKGSRNPQTAMLNGVYVLHCRGIGFDNFLLYTSENGYDWEEGHVLVEEKAAPAFYSNNLNLTDEKGDFLLVQYSERYERMCVNVMHQNIRIKK